MTALLLYSGTFSRAEQRVLRTIFAAMTDDGGKCAATLTTLPVFIARLLLAPKGTVARGARALAKLGFDAIAVHGRATTAENIGR
jgi:hypothetical protein